MTVRSTTGAQRELRAAHEAGLHGISYRRHIESAGGEELSFDDEPRPTGHAQALKDAWRSGNAQRRSQRRSAAATSAGRAVRAARAGTPSVSRRDVRQAGRTFEGSGTFTGLVVGALLLVLLYVLLQHTKVMTSAATGVTGFLARFMSPAYPLF